MSKTITVIDKEGNECDVTVETKYSEGCNIVLSNVGNDNILLTINDNTTHYGDDGFIFHNNL